MNYEGPEVGLDVYFCPVFGFEIEFEVPVFFDF